MRKLYYNENNDGPIRANLVYTPYTENNTFIMSFNRDPEYHFDNDANVLFTEEILADRFDRELRFHEKVKRVLPTLDIIDVDYMKREIYLEWPSDDFYMLGRNTSYDQVLPDWKEQWLHIIRTLRRVNVSKFSLHPNSFVVKNNRLIPFNWFFCFERDELTSLSSVIKQISTERFDKLAPLLNKHNINIDDVKPAREFEQLGLECFTSSYTPDLIEEAIKWV